MNVVTPRDVPWTGTGGLTDTQSYSWIILNAIFNRLSATTFFAPFAMKRLSSALPIEAWSQVPFLGTFLTSEDMVTDGDLGVGDIRFIHSVQIGIQVGVQNNDATAMLKVLDQASWFALNQLLRDNKLTNRLKTDLPDNVTIEGFPKVRFRPDVWGLTGSANEIPIGERIFWLTYQIRSWFAPTDFDDLQMIAVTTNLGDTPSDVQQVKIVYEFNPDAVQPPLPATPVP